MKNLYLIRHAKSDWDDISLRDFDRPLNKRGYRNAPFMADKLKEKLGGIDGVISSPANRAITTANYFANAFGIETTAIQKEEKIYEAPVSSLLEVLNGLNNEWNTVLMFGHNPGFSYLVHYLTGQTCEMPTCSIAHLQFEMEDWTLISASTGKLIGLDYPKRYGQ